MNTGQTTATILVIDNDPLTMTAIAAAMYWTGHECHCARDSEAALKAARNEPLDLIICDAELGEENGVELCQELRQVPGLAEVPVIFISSSRAAEMVERTREAGGVYYLRKPFDPEVLLELAEKALWMPHLVGTRLRRPAAKKTLSTN